MDRAPSRTRAIGYLRVSTDKQVDGGVSLDAQQAKIEAYSQLYDLDLVAIEVDAGVSAKTMSRPALERVLADLKGGKADALLVVKLDRLTRSVRDLGFLVDDYFADGRYSLMSVSENIDTRTAAGRLVLNVLASVAQWEREAVGERTSVAMRHKASKNEFTGGRVPYGFKLSKDGIHLIENESEQKVIAEVHRLRDMGLSLRAISSELAKRGYLSRQAKRFGPQQIKGMLRVAETAEKVA